MTGSRTPATCVVASLRFEISEIAETYSIPVRDLRDQSPAFNPSAIPPDGHVPSKSCPSGADQSPEQKLEDFLRKARAL